MGALSLLLRDFDQEHEVQIAHRHHNRAAVLANATTINAFGFGELGFFKTDKKRFKSRGRTANKSSQAPPMKYRSLADFFQNRRSLSDHDIAELKLVARALQANAQSSAAGYSSRTRSYSVLGEAISMGCELATIEMVAQAFDPSKEKFDLADDLRSRVHRHGPVAWLQIAHRVLPWASDKDKGKIAYDVVRIGETLNNQPDLHPQLIDLFARVINSHIAQSQNSSLVSDAASIPHQNLRHEILNHLIPLAQPGKAARHAVYLQRAHLADQILSHPKTPVDLLPGVIEYAASRHLDLPLAKARASHAQLTQETIGQVHQKQQQEQHGEKEAHRRKM